MPRLSSLSRLPRMLPVFCIAAVIALFSAPPPSFGIDTNEAVERELAMLSMFFDPNELVITATRSPKPLSQVAENMTIINSREIEEMHAHTVAEVLNRATGVFVGFQGQDYSGSSLLHVQGSSEKQVLILFDGIPWNLLDSASSDPSMIPVHAIERIEIIKGPASSSWGSSLGGVINIISKQAGSATKPRINAGASYGQEASQDQYANVRGNAGSVGYFLNVGRQTSNGLRDGRHFDTYDMFSKFRIPTGDASSLTLTASYSEPREKQGFKAFDVSVTGLTRFYHTSIDYNADLSESVSMALRAYRLRQKYVQGGDMGTWLYDEQTDGGQARLSYRGDRHSLVAGADYRHGSIESESAPDVDEWGAYANDTIEMGMLCVTPGIRFDRTEFGGKFTSPSLGATYRLNDNTLLRAQASQGFRAPTLADAYTGGFNYTPNPDLKPERVRSLQAGIETIFHEALRLKGLIYQHFTDDVIVGGDQTSDNRDKRRIRGGEIEVEARPLDMVSLKAGAAYADIKTSTKDAIDTYTKAIYQYNLGVAYDNPASFRAELSGHYSWWSAQDYTLEPKYNGFIVDASLTKHLDVSLMSRLDIFLTAHNIFNASQYSDGLYKNPKRWVEGGLSVAF